MTAKDAVKWLTPPILIEAQRFLRGTRLRRHIWEGIYPGFHDVPVFGPGHDSPHWLENSLGLTKHFLRAWRQERSIPAHVWAMRSLMPLAAAMIAPANGKLRVLDFGGGMGTDYICLRSCLDAAVCVDYHVVDGEQSCAYGDELFQGDRSISFHRRLPSDIGPVNLVYSSQALQYVDDFVSLLTSLAAYQAPYFMLVSVPVGEAPRFATAQINFPDTCVPYWFFNRTEMLDLMDHLGYRRIYVSCPDRIYDMDNFPVTHRVPQHTNWLFARTE